MFLTVDFTHNYVVHYVDNIFYLQVTATLSEDDEQMYDENEYGKLTNIMY